MRAAVLNGLPDGFFSESFAGVNGDVEILALDVVKRVDVFFGRVAAFLTGEVEADDASIAKVDGEFGHFERDVHIAHGADDQAGRNSKVMFAALQSLENRR